MLDKLKEIKLFRNFAAMLAEELLRKELQEKYGPDIFLFKFRTRILPVVKSRVQHTVTDITEREQSLRELRGRRIHMSTFIGPVASSAEPKKQSILSVEAFVRLFSTEDHIWEPHYMHLFYFTEAGAPMTTLTYCYEPGVIEEGGKGVYYGVPGQPNGNPCAVMVKMQRELKQFEPL